MDNIILNGSLLGLFLSFYIGPVFFLLIETSIKKGARQAFLLDIGILLSDALMLVLVLKISNQLEEIINTGWMNIVGGVIFISFGLAKILLQKKSKVETEKTVVPQKLTKAYIGVFTQGFALNILNPGVALFWIAAVTYSQSNLGYNGWDQRYYYLATFLTIIIVDSVKIVLAKKLRSNFTPKVLLIINYIIGILLSLAGIALLFKNHLF